MDHCHPCAGCVFPGKNQTAPPPPSANVQRAPDFIWSRHAPTVAERCGLPPQPVPSRLVGQSKKTKRGRSSPSLLGVQGMCDESLFHKLTCWYRTNDRALQQLGASHKQVQSASSRGIQQ
jgi:hypothetical protein